MSSLANQDRTARAAVLRDLLAALGDGTQILSPFFCDYGWNIRIGRNGFINYDCVFLDCNQITIGAAYHFGAGKLSH